MARLAGPAPDPSTLRAGIPADLVAIDRKALATEPADRWSSSAAMAAALEAFLAGTAIPGVGTAGAADATIATNRPGAGGAAAAAGAAGVAAAAAGAGLAATSATARPNPGAIPYVPDAYADEPRPRSRPSDPYTRTPPTQGGRGGAGRPPVRPVEEDDEEPRGTSPAVWAAGILALLILAAVAFLVFRLLSGPGTTPAAQVTVPNFVNLPLSTAQAQATQLGLVLNSTTTTPAASGVDPNDVTSQDPPAGTKVAAGSTVRLTIAVGPTTVSVPDLRGKPEQEAFNLLAAARLQLGAKTEAFDPIVPAGSVVSTTPSAGVLVTEQTPIDYVLSKGPEPSPSPSPSPSPTPTPTPTPPPTPPPTPTPPPAKVTVADYRCQTLAEARIEIEGDSLVVGTVTPQPGGYPGGEDAIVIEQDPTPGKKVAPGTAVDLVVYDPASLGTCPP